MTRNVFFEGEVRQEWIDEYGHMGYLDYQRAADHGTMGFWAAVNGGRGQDRREGREFAIVDVHARYLRELRLGDRLQVATTLVAYDEKRFTLMHELASNAKLCAVVSLRCLSFHLGDRRVHPFDDSVLARLAAFFDPAAASAASVPLCLLSPGGQR